MKKTIRDYDVSGKKVLVRCDYNVPIKDGKIVDDSKILASLATINYLISHDAKIILMSHLGKVKTEEDKVSNSLEIVAKRLQQLVDTNIIFSKEVRSESVLEKSKQLNNRDILFLENVRYEDVPQKLESSCDEELSKYYASLADIFCLDGFGSCHRKHSSTYGVANYIPNCVGLLVEKEIEMLDKVVKNPERPFTIIMGGAKVDDKLDLIEALLPICDNLLLAGGLANSCMYTLGYNVGSSLKSDDADLLSRLKKLLLDNKDKIQLPVDFIVKNNVSNSIRCVDISNVNTEDAIGDIGSKTIEKYKNTIDNSKLIFVNGTPGKYEDDEFSFGTRELFKIVSLSNALKVVGGGDGVSAVKYFNYEDSFDFLSTGGGATLEYIINKGLVAIDNIDDK